jgi:hypothetical protein
MKAHAEQLGRRIGGQRAGLEGRVAAGLDGLPGHPQQVGRADEADGVERERHGQQQRREAERGREQMHQEGHQHAAQRDQSGAAALDSVREMQ